MPIAATIRNIGWAHAMAIWGLGQGIIAVGAAMILRHPPAGWVPAGWDQKAKKVNKAVAQSKVNFTWIQTLGRPEFYLLYTMFFFATAGGLIATANLSQIAKSLHVSDAKVWGFAIVPLAATLTSACNALSRIIWGSVSDKLGRERTMFLTFGVEAILVYLVTKIAGAPIAFVLLFGFIFLFWGEIYSLFSATTGDIFGPKHASANYGMVYTAKGAASVFAGFGAAAIAAYFGGSFFVPFYISAVLCGIAALCSILVLRPLLRSRIASEARTDEGKALTAALKQVSAPPQPEKHLTGTGR